VTSRTRLAALASRYGLGEEGTERLSRLLRALLEDPLAPTAIRSPVRAIDDHLADSLVGLEVPEVRAARRAADLGSGAGLPALPLAVAMPDTRFTLVESAGRKCDFLTRTAAACGLANVEIARARAEELGTPADYDLVTVRALAELAVVAEYAAPLLRVGATLLAWRGRRDGDGEQAAARAAAALGLELGPVLRVEPYPGARERHLHVVTKVAETPARFPRRPGVALKRPLGR
jgi:16S rRNA (guanine527-N7)-methyltransferase